MTVRYQETLEGIGPAQLAGFWVGWPVPPSPATHLRMLRGSEVFVLAVDDETGGRVVGFVNAVGDGVDETGGRVVGFVNAVGDGVLAAYVPCLEVLPEYQGQGIGTELVRRLLDRLRDRYMVDLVCDDDVVPFYERLGMRRWGAMILRRRSAIAAQEETR